MTRACSEVRDLLDSYLSGELLVETNHVVLNHLATCRTCAAEAECRQRLIGLLRHGHELEVETAALRQQINATLDREGRWWRRVTRSVLDISSHRCGYR